MNRMKLDTPKFFRKLRATGIILTTISATLLTTPVALPPILIKIAGYLALLRVFFDTASGVIRRLANNSR
jgi:hypothetical protein